MSTDRLAAMELFVRVVDAGSFSAELIVRTTRNLSLTDAGRKFYDNAKHATVAVDGGRTAI